MLSFLVRLLCLHLKRKQSFVVDPWLEQGMAECNAPCRPYKAKPSYSGDVFDS